MLNIFHTRSGSIVLALMLVCAFGFSGAGAQTADSLTKKAQEAYAQKHFEQSAELYAAAIKQGDTDTNTLYNAACSFALAGKKDEAFKHLQSAVNKGWYNIDHLQKDTDLDSLHNDPRWAALVEKTAASARVQKVMWDSPALKTEYRENLSDDEKVAGLSKFWSEIKYNFANFALVPDLDWDGLYLAYLPKVKQTRSTLEYYKVMMEFCAKLKDGHTNVNPPDALTNEFYSRPLVATRLIEDKVIITRTFDEQLASGGIKPGLEIFEINSVPVKQYAAQAITPYQSASTKQDLDVRTYTYRLLSGSSKVPVALTLKDENGNVFKKSLPRVGLQEVAKLMFSTPPMEFKMLAGNVAYVALNSFNDNKAAEMFEAAFAEIAKSDALIIDVRNNGGGNSNVGYRVISALTDKPFKTSRWATRDYRPSFRAWGRPQGNYEQEAGEYGASGSRLYTKPVVVLTSARTYSAAEDFCVAFDYMKRGLIIGEPTGGSTGQPLFFSLPGGGSARVCTKHDSYPDGKEFVGVGIQPGKVVAETVKDLRAGRDTVLEAALVELSKITKKPAPSRSAIR